MNLCHAALEGGLELGDREAWWIFWCCVLGFIALIALELLAGLVVRCWPRRGMARWRVPPPEAPSAREPAPTPAPPPKRCTKCSCERAVRR